jgi:hypothetical protein
MDFSSLPTASIDFSPSPHISSTSLVLDEPELATAEFQQLQRFWTVWHTDRQASAPHLRMLTLILRPGYANNAPVYTGIHRFVDYYKNVVEPSCKTTGLQIYLDDMTACVDSMRHNTARAPVLLISKPVKQPPAGAHSEPSPTPC